MLEYWFQVELYRAVQIGASSSWQHLGFFEQPYYTELPRTGSKTNTKWIDLVCASPNAIEPELILPNNFGHCSKRLV
jgi:hypothetical protein